MSKYRRVEIPATNNSFFSIIVFTLCVCGAIVYLYWPAINGGLVWDDAELLYANNLLTLDNWFHNSFEKCFLGENYYRPLPLLTLMWNGVWGAEMFPLVAHATNVGLLCINTMLIMLLVSRKAQQIWPASMLAGAIYAFHPALLESTSWISGRCDLLLVLFVLLALLFDLLLRKHFLIRVLVVSILFFLAALSKEKFREILLPFLC